MMRHQNQKKRTYAVPQSIPTDVALEKAFLVGATNRMLLTVDPLVNKATNGEDEAGGETYFEF